MKILTGFQDTRTNKEDFALTPYLFGVWVKGHLITVCGVGLCWGFYSVYVGIGFNIPKAHSGFRSITLKNNFIKKRAGNEN